MLWDITTKFLPVEDLIRSQLFIKFDGYSLKNGAAMPLTISNFPRAWQAYFLSNTLQIWLENTSFDNLQMMWNNVFDTSIGFRFEKIWWAAPYISIACTWIELCLKKLNKSFKNPILHITKNTVSWETGESDKHSSVNNFL